MSSALLLIVLLVIGPYFETLPKVSWEYRVMKARAELNDKKQTNFIKEF